MEYRPANRDDIPAVAALFLDSFAPSVIHFLGQPLINDRSICDVFSFILKAEPRGFLVACDGPNVAGYLVICRNMRMVWLKALFFGDIFIWAFGFLTGRYSLDRAAVKSIIRHKFLFLFSKHNYRAASQAQVLSISVHSAHRNRGIATNLLIKGLDCLEGVREIKLEVRPQNRSAIRLYTTLGFETAGSTFDSQGEWLIMIKKA